MQPPLQSVPEHFHDPETPHPPAAVTPSSPLPHLPNPSPVPDLAGLRLCNGRAGDAHAVVWGPHGRGPRLRARERRPPFLPSPCPTGEVLLSRVLFPPKIFGINQVVTLALWSYLPSLIINIYLLSCFAVQYISAHYSFGAQFYFLLVCSLTSCCLITGVGPWVCCALQSPAGGPAHITQLRGYFLWRPIGRIRTAPAFLLHVFCLSVNIPSK